MKIVRKSLALLLALLVLATSGCGSNTSWAFERDGVRLPAGLYINFMMYALSELETEAINAHADDDTYSPPETKAFLKERSDGVTNSERVRQMATDMAAEYFVLDAELAKLEVTLSEEDISYIRNYVAYIWSSGGAMFEQNGVSQSSVELYQMHLMKKDYLFEALYSQDGEKAPPEEELRAEFLERYAKVDIMYIDANTEAGELDTAKKAQAESIFEQYKKGAAIEELDYQYKLDTAAEADAETVVKGETGANAQFVYIKDLTEDLMVQNAVAQAKMGEPVLFEYDNTFYLFTRLDPADGFADYRDAIVYDMKYSEFEQYLKELAGSADLVANQAAVNRYTPEKIKIS